jgi:hypothetical protein
MRFKLSAVPGWSLTTWGSKFPLSLDGSLQHAAQIFRCPLIISYTTGYRRDKNPVLSQFGNYTFNLFFFNTISMKSPSLFLNPLRTMINLNYFWRLSSYRAVNTIRLRCKNQLADAVDGEKVAVCSEIHTKHMNTQCGQNVELVVHIGRNNWALTFYILSADCFI